MERWNGRVALVTGASAGIGAALVRTLASCGLKVVACARNLERLEALKNELSGSCPGTVLPNRCDLKNEKQILEMFDQIKKEHGRIDVCINNAGLAFPASLVDGATDDWREMFEVNVLALTICTREAIQLMKASNVTDGHIIHISSMDGHRVELGGSFYACTKHAVKALTEGLRLELLSSNMDTRVTSISPGVVATEFVARMHRHDESVLSKMESASYKALEAQDIVDAVIYALSAPLHCQVSDIQMRPVHQPT